MTTTVKIKPSHPSQGEFVLIEKKDFDPSKHELLEGESLGDDGAARGDGVPTLKELLAGQAQLAARKDQLDDLELQLSQRGDALSEREAELRQRASEFDAREQKLVDREAAAAERELANAAEAQRLADVAAAQAAKATEKPASTKKAPAATGDDAK